MTERIEKELIQKFLDNFLQTLEERREPLRELSLVCLVQGKHPQSSNNVTTVELSNSLLTELISTYP